LLRSIDFARDIGANLVNVHLYVDDGPQGFVRALEPVLRYAAAAKLRLSIENTPQTTPEDFNQTFACLAELAAIPADTFGMCLDIGHANLCRTTHNNFIRYLDLLADTVPIIHVHAHENHGDRDSHLTLFTGPSREDDTGIRSFVKRLRRRAYPGAVILEQWPAPPQLLADCFLSKGHPRTILGPPDREAQEAIARRVVDEGLSVRATEELVRQSRQTAPQSETNPPDRAAPPSKPPAILELEELLSTKLDTRVKIQIGANKGKIVIEFSDLSDLERVYNIMVGA